MATKEDQENLRLLVQYVSRAFYEPKFVVILDQLARHPVLKDDDLAGRIGLQAKELNKVMAVLTNDRLVQVHRQNELKDGAQRSIGKQYYYIDYQHFCNVVKWRVAEMHRLINTTAGIEQSTKGFMCPNCKATFSTLEADRLIDFTLGTFFCDICPTSPGGPHELVENNSEEGGKGKNDRMERFNYQTKFIQEGLRKSESMTLPAFDVAVWVKNNVHDVEKAKQAQNGGLKIAGADGKREEQGISIMMSVDKDEATRRKEREAEADAKRQQNMLPTWHLKSTISNDLTALGVAAANQMANGKLTGNEAILSGLGKPKSDGDVLTGLGRANTKKEQTSISIVEEEKKPEIDEQTAYYDKWYADLEASSKAQSALQTPKPEVVLNDFDEEERKPNIALLDAANGFAHFARKRSRSRSSDREGERGSKALRSNAGTPVYSRPASAVGSPTPSVNSVPPPAENSTATPMPDEPMVMVGGELMPFSLVTQEIADERMTPEEYTEWYEVMMAQ